MRRFNILGDKIKEIKTITFPCLKMFLQKTAALLVVVILSIVLIVFSLQIEEGVSAVATLMNSKDFLNLVVSINITLMIEMFERYGNNELNGFRNFALIITVMSLCFGMLIITNFDRNNNIYYFDVYKTCISHKYEFVVLLITVVDYMVLSCEATIIKRKKSNHAEI